MTPAATAWTGVAVLAGLGYLLEGNPDPDTWAALFWLSALVNLVLAVIVSDLRNRQKQQQRTAHKAAQSGTDCPR